MVKQHFIIFIYIKHIYIHSLINAHLDDFYSLATVNNAAMNLEVKIALREIDSILFGYESRTRINGSNGSFQLQLFLEEILYCFPQQLYQFKFLPAVLQDSHIFTFLQRHVCYILLFCYACYYTEVIVHYDFDLNFSDDQLSTFVYTCWPFMCLFFFFPREMSIQVLCTFFKWGCLLFCH